MMGTSNPCLFSKHVLCGIIVVLFVANGLSAETCRKGCPKSDTEKLKYQPGQAYEYKFDSIITIGVHSVDEEETSLKVTGSAMLYAEGNCAYTLKLDKVNVQTTRESLRKQLSYGINKPVQFTLSNGELDTKICTEQNDNEFGLNVKRAIISLLQSTDKSYETDVFGLCPTVQSTEVGNGYNIVTQSRNLNLCSYRENYVNGIMTSIVDEKSGVKASSYLYGDYNKKQKLVNGIYESIELFEEYKFTPLSTGKNSVDTKVKTTMKLVTNQPSPAPQLGKNIKTESIIFNHPSPMPVKNLPILKKTLDSTINLVSDYAKIDSAQHFTELIRLMRHADTETLTELSKHQHQNKNLARKVYYDALFRVGTSEAVKSIVEQIPKMNDKEKRFAFMSFNLVDTITKDALTQVSSLLAENSPREAYLSIGTLVNKYCQKEACDQKEINAISKKFVDSLKHCKANTKQEEDHIVGVLKGIRNTHKIADASAQQLIECIQKDRSARVRVAALQAFTSASCNQNLQDKSLDILKDHNEDSEIRIEAYLSAVACPNVNVANQIADIVNTETVNQVGGFISTHLKAIRDSTDFTRESARHHLGNIRITKKFPIDPRRFSFNSELSYAVETLGVGASADYNLIYSQNGFLPRSGKLNLTTVMFGQSFNTMEFNVRQENLEDILEYYLGPKGFFNKEPQEIFDQLNSHRSKRSITDDTKSLSDKYKTYGHNKFNNDINLDLSLKLFGSEFTFLSLGDNIPSSADELTRELGKCFTKLRQNLKKFEHNWEYHSLFYDVEIVYPTGIGFPLEINGQGTATGKLDFSTEIDIEKILENPKNSKYHIKIVPSIDINISGKLRIDGGVIHTGLYITNNLHSASGGDIKLEIINDATGFNIDLDLPRENLELIDIKRNIDFYVAEQDKELKLLPFKQNKKRKQNVQPNCFDQLQIFGLTVCYTAALPDVQNFEAYMFPMMGPLQIGVTLQSERKIKLNGLYQMHPTHQSWQLLYDTPGSQKSHNTKLQFDLGVNPKLYARLDFKNPEKYLAAETGLQNDDKEFAIYGKLEIDQDVTLRKIGFTKNGNEYRPLIQMSNRDSVKDDIAGYKADGRVLVTKNGDITKYKFDNFRLIKPNNEATIVNGWIENDYTRGFKSQLKINDGVNRFTVDSHCNIDQNRGFSIGAFATNDDKPDMTTGGSLLLQFADKMLKHELKLQAGDNHFNLHNEIQCDGNDKIEFKHCKFFNDLSVKNKNLITVSGKLNGEYDEKLIMYDFEATRNDKRIALTFKYDFDQKSQGDYDLDINAKLNRHFIDLKLKTDIKNGKYHIDHNLITSWGTKASTKGDIGQRFTTQDAYIDLGGKIQLLPKEKETDWSLKLTGQLEKCKTEFKLQRDKIEFINFNCELNRPADKAIIGNVDLKIRETLTAKGNFKIGQNGRGDLSGLINLKKTQQDIKIDSKFTYSQPKYDLDTTITFGDNKKISYKTENIIDRNKYVTKNLLEIGTEKIQFDSNGNIKGSDIMIEHEIDGKFDLKLPTGRQINGFIKRRISAKNRNGLLDIGLTDSPPNDKKRSILIKSLLTDYDLKTRTFAVHKDITYSDLNDKTVDIKFDVKHLPKGQYRQAEFGIKIHGTKLPQQIEFNLNLDEFCKEHAVYRLNGKYGTKFMGNINGNYHLLDRSKPATYEIQANIDIPDSEMKQYKLQSNGKYLQPETENGIYELELNLLENIGNKEIKFNSNIKGNGQHGQYQISTNSPWNGPMKFNGNYMQEEIDLNNGKYQYGVEYDFGKYGKLQTDIDIKLIPNNINLHYKLISSYDSVKNFDIQFKGTKSDSDIIANTQLNHNGKSYTMDTILYIGDYKTGADIKMITPTVTTIVTGIVERLGERKGKAQIVLKNLGGIDLIGSAETSLQNFENFYIKIDLDSQKLKLNKFHIDANTQPGGKIIQFNVVDAKEKILSGTAQYNIKQEKGKTIVEGQGTIKYYQEETNAIIKLTQQTYDMVNDKEVGISYSFTGQFGPKNIVSTLKFTNKNFLIKLNTCEDKKQCTIFQIESDVNVDANDLSQAQHKLLVLIDLIKLGYPYEFELQSKTTRNGYKVVHEIEMNVISNNNNKYQFLANLQPNNGLIQFKLPKRSVVLETSHIIPKNGIFGKYEDSITFYFDKENNPNDKTQLLLTGQMGGIKNNAINGEFIIKFEHPTVRPLSISGKLDVNRDKQLATTNIQFDLFKTPDHKIIGEAKIYGSDFTGNGYNITSEANFKSTGLGFEYLSQAHSAISWKKNELTVGSMFESIGTDLKFNTFVMANKNKFEIYVNGLNHELMKIDGTLNSANHKLMINSKFQLFGSKPIEMLTELEPRGGKFVLKRNGMFDATGEMKIGKEATFLVNGYGKKLYNGRIMLDPANLLSTTYEVEDENVRSFLHDAEIEYTKDRKQSIEEIDKKFRKMQNLIVQRIQNTKQSAPEFTKLRTNYQQNLNSIVKELEEDPALKEIIDLYRRAYETFVKFMTEFMKTVTESYEKIQQSVAELYEKLSITFKDQILPAWQELISKLTEIFGEFNAEAMKIFGTVFERTVKALQGFKENLSNLGKPLAELLKPLAEMLTELFKTLAKEWDEFWREIEDYWNKLPSLKEYGNHIYEKISKLKTVDEFLAILKDVFDHLEVYTVSEECQIFLKKLYSYIEAKLRNKDINDIEALESLYYSFVQAIRSLLSTFGDGTSPASYLHPLPFSYDALSKIPSWISFRFSPFNYLRNEKFDGLTYLLSYRPPFDLIPPYELRGHVADGQHIFTFDGRHITLPGSCKYVLAQDYVNNNFSVVANLKDGKMKSIILIDKQNYIEVNDKGLIILNGKPTEYPIHDNDLHAWRKYYTVSLLSEYGVLVMCTTDLRVCHINVNGFYTGKTRGLLGNGNAEQYDDFTKPDGLITNDYAQFGNSYGLGKCQPLQSIQHQSHTNEDLCTELFNYESNLILGYIFIDPSIYREACNHAVMSAQTEQLKDDAACNIALTYASAARMDYLPVDVPEKCLQCKSTGQGSHNLGNDFKTIVPNTMADIVFIVDTSVNNDILGTFMQTMIKDIRDQLKTRGMTNVNIAVIGYNEEQKYPQLYTTNGKINFNGDLLKMNLMGPKKEQFADIGIEKLNEFLIKLQNVRTSLQETSGKATDMALKYPFRSGAARSIVFVRNNHFKSFGSLLNNFGAMASSLILQKKGIFLHYIGPVDDLSVEGVPTEKIVGFNKRAIATIEGKDAKKRGKLHYTSDIGAEVIQENYGWIFALQNYELLKSPDQKLKYTQQVTSAIADQLYKTNVDYNCKCSTAYGLHAEEVCYSSTTTFDANKKPK